MCVRLISSIPPTMTAITSIWCRCRPRAGASDPVVGDVTVNVTNVAESGVVVLSSPQPQVGTPLGAAVVDPDGVLTVQTWIWQRSLNGAPWSNIAAAATSSYAPEAADVGYDLRVEAAYLDGTGSYTAAVEAVYSTRAAPSTNNAPDFANSTVERSVAENSTPGTAVRAAVGASDVDSGDAAKLAYTLSGAGCGPLWHRRHHGPDPGRLGHGIGL